MALTDTVKNAAYVTIGFGVLGLQKAQVRRQELQKSVASIAGHLDAVVAPVRTQVEAGLDGVEASLPPAAQDVLKQVRQTAQHQERAIRNLLGV